METTDKPWFSSYDEGVPFQLDYPKRTLVEQLKETARKFPKRPAVDFFGKRLSYAELWRAVQRFAWVLKQEGLQPGETVALYLPNTPAVVIAYYGILAAGGVVTQLNPLYAAPETLHQLKDSQARRVVTLDRFLPILEEVRKEWTLSRVFIVRLHRELPFWLSWLYPLKARREGSWVPWPSDPVYVSFHDVLSCAEDREAEFPRNLDDLALLQYTGGTTGTAKGVMLTHRNLIANTWQAALWVPGLKAGEEVILLAIPVFHCYGMTVGMNLAVTLAACMVLLPKFDPLQVLKSIHRTRATLFPGVNAMYAALNTHPQTPKYRLRSIKACISGAGPLYRQTQEQFEALTGGKVVEGYGLTEASPVTHCNPVFGKRKLGTIGVPLPGTDAKIVDVETGERELPLGEAGEIVVRGPQVMLGYWNRPEETKQVLRNGWLHTGDIGVQDEEGFFTIVDRKKDMIKVGGENVYPREVEEELLRHPAVAEAAVIGVPEERFGEVPKAFVVPKAGKNPTAEEILEFLRNRLAKYKVPKEVELREALPKNMVGKMLRRVLSEEEIQKRKGEKA